VVNRNIYELKYLKKNFCMESEAQITDNPTRVEDREMSQRSIQKTNLEIPEQEGVEGEEGETNQGGNTSYQERREGQEDETSDATCNS
jgi:hypothetical protein